MSAIPNAVTFDFRGSATLLERDLDQAERRLARTAANVDRINATAHVGIDTQRLEADAKRAEDTIKRVERTAADAGKRAAAAVSGGSGGGGGGGGGLGGDLGVGGGIGGGTGGSGFGRFGAIGLALSGVRALGSGFEELSKAILEGTNRTEAFFRGLAEGIPFIGGAVKGLADFMTEANNLRLLRAAGLNTPEENEAMGRGFDPGIKAIRGAGEAIDRAEEVARREGETAGLSGFDLERARAKKRAEQQALAVGKQLDAIPSEADSKARGELEERFLKLQKHIEDNLEKELQGINAQEGIKEFGKSLREWFKDLSDRVKQEAKDKREEDKLFEELQKNEQKENELRVKRDRRDQKEAEAVDFEARQIELKSGGQGRRAQLEAVKERLRRGLAETDDPVLRNALGHRAAAELQAMLSGNSGVSGRVVASPGLTALRSAAGGDNVDRTLKTTIAGLLTQIRDKDYTAVTN